MSDNSSKRMILELLAQGKITQEQAGQLLAAMEDEDEPEASQPQEAAEPANSGSGAVEEAALLAKKDGGQESVTLTLHPENAPRNAGGPPQEPAWMTAEEVQRPVPPAMPAPPAPPAPPSPPAPPAPPAPPVPPAPPAPPEANDHEALEAYRERMEELQERYREIMEAYQEQVEEQNEAYQDQMQAYQEQVEEQNEAYQEQMQAYQEQVAEQNEAHAGQAAQQPPHSHRANGSSPLQDAEYSRIYSEAYDAVYRPAYEALYNKFGPGTEGFREEVQRIAEEAAQAGQAAVERARAERSRGPEGQPRGWSKTTGGWGAWLNSLGREINQAMSGIGEEIGIDLNEAMADVADAVSDLKESLRGMVDDWQEQKDDEDDEDFPDFGDEDEEDEEVDEEDDSAREGGVRVECRGGQQAGEYVNAASISMNALEKLEIHWFSGGVAVEPWDGDYVEVAEFSKKPLEPNQRMEVYGKDGEKLTIEWSPKKFGWNKLACKSKRLTVRVPRALSGQIEKLYINAISASVKLRELSGESFEASTVSGTIVAQGLHCEGLRLHAVSGTVAAEGVSAEKLKLSSVSGTVKTEGFSAELAELSTVSGTLRAHGNAERFRVNTTSGSAELAVDQCPEEAKLSSVSGGLCLTLPENQGFTVRYNSISGGFHTDFPAVVTGDGKKKKGKAVYGGGETKIEMNTTSGSMRIKKQP